jgi:hypothetical protein
MIDRTVLRIISTIVALLTIISMVVFLLIPLFA